MRIKCKNCGLSYNHFDEHKCKKLVRTQVAESIDVPALVTIANDEPSKRADSGSSTYKYRDPIKRREYMRDKMRERRAK